MFFDAYDSNFNYIANYTSGSCIGVYPLAQTQGRWWNAIKRMVNVVATILVEIIPAALTAGAAAGSISGLMFGPAAAPFGAAVGLFVGYWIGFARGVDRVNKGNLVCVLPPCN